MSGLTSSGFVAERTPELKLELEQLLIAAFGPINLGPSAVFGQLVGLTVEQQADFWAKLEEVYWSQYPDSAVGINLDRAVSINGLVRLAQQPTFVLGVASGVLGTLLPAGRLVRSTVVGREFTNPEPLIINTEESVGARIVVNTVVAVTVYSVSLGGIVYSYTSDGSPTVEAILTNLEAAMPVGVTTNLVIGDISYLDLSYDTPQDITVTPELTMQFVSNYINLEGTTPGPFSLPANSLDLISTPVAGWETIGNRFPGTPGRFAETDDELRLRRVQSLRLAGRGTIESIVSQLQQVPGVLDQKVYVNNGSSTDSNGVEAHTIWAVVDGGTDAAVAKVLFDYVAAGIGLKGSVTESVVSEVTGSVYSIKFERPTNIPFYVSIEIKKSANTPTNVISILRDSLVAYAQEEIHIADPVLYTRLFSPINEVIGDGAYVTELYLNSVPIVGPGDELTANLVPEPDERYTLQATDIQIVVTP